MQQFSLFDGCDCRMQMCFPEALRSLDLYNCLYYSQESDSNKSNVGGKNRRASAGSDSAFCIALGGERFKQKLHEDKRHEGICGTAISCQEVNEVK